MAKVKIELEFDLDRPLKNAEEERYLCASLEEGVSNGWYDFLMTAESMPAQPRKVRARLIR